MKKLSLVHSLTLFLFGMLCSFSLSAQNNAASRPSPAATATGKVGAATVTVNYSSPAVKGRTIWGELVPYGKVWRAGANEATTFEIDKPVTVEGKTLAAGKYALFTIPGEKEWTIIFNKVASQWGAYKYDEKQDALRVTVTPRKGTFTESLKYNVDKNGLVLNWENLEVPVKIK